MPFGLNNAPATSQRFVNDTLPEYLDQFCVYYIDDFLILWETFKEHRKEVRKVLQKLNDFGLFIKPEKCGFTVSETSFLGFVMSEDSIEMDHEKVNAILG